MMLRTSQPVIKVGRPGISSLALPTDRFDVSLTPGFETEADKTAEDATRTGLLQRSVSRLRAEARDLAERVVRHQSDTEKVEKLAAQAAALRTRAGQVSRLADRIDPEITDHPSTLASALYMRDQRVRVLSPIWRHVYDAQQASPGSVVASTFTAVPAGSSIPLGHLDGFDPKRWLRTFRGHVNRVIGELSIKPSGWMFACIHGAYDIATCSYPIHLHGIVTEDLIGVVDRLRGLRMYQRSEPGDDRDAAHTPLVVSRGLLSNMPDPMTYSMKSWWPQRETRIDEDGVRRAFPNSHRIPEPAHTEYLMFLDRWRLEDITLLMGLHVTNGGLKRC